MTYKLYNYDPSSSAAVAFAVIFGLSAAYHIWQVIRKRSWFFIPFVIGVIFETVGYAARYYSAKQTPDWTTMPYVLQELFLLLAPSFFAASIYMILGRVIRLLNGESNSLIRPSWLTKIFVTGDVLSFLMQSSGGGMLATAKTTSSVSLGENIIVAGLFVQVISFGVFILVSIIFHRRMLMTPMHLLVKTRIPWTQYMRVLYSGSALILVRSIYRVAEYIQGNSGYLQSKEVYVYVFDTTLMVICCLLFNYFHPSDILSKSHDIEEREDLEMMNQAGYRNYGE
ncbi:uncharacterized protein N7484_009968 [Penicillium longicatenatum]|uniref:uncharacterized protein n=1 Tax=Penicillium longicatenatum TaxID=1561947 RepID=UPI002548E006|nr:uncharacterized protein N7484_009968 [Penicillium longicatenatum]KAJ5636655.1 hypothetical protein N7484_009968 [Penicillium longicatenatum]